MAAQGTNVNATHPVAVPEEAPTAASPLPALPTLGRLGAVASTPVPRKIVELIPFRLRSAIGILVSRPPVIAGQRIEEYFQLLEIAVREWMPQTLFACWLVVQLVDAEFEILSLKQVQTWLFNAAIGAEFLAILNADKVGTDPRRLQALKHVIFAALAGHAEAIAYVEGQTGRAIGLGPETQVQFAMPAHIFADRAITTRLARHDAAISRLQAIKADSAARMANDRHIDVANIRSLLSLSEYVRALIELDLAKQAEPELYAEQMLKALERRKEATAADATNGTDAESAPAPAEPASAPLTPGEEFMGELAQRKHGKAEVTAAQTGAADPVSVRAPKTAGASCNQAMPVFNHAKPVAEHAEASEAPLERTGAPMPSGQ